MFEREREKPFRESKGRKKEPGRIFGSQEEDEDKSDAPVSFEPALDPETESRESEVVVEKPVETLVLQGIVSGENKSVIEKKDGVDAGENKESLAIKIAMLIDTKDLKAINKLTDLIVGKINKKRGKLKHYENALKKIPSTRIVRITKCEELIEESKHDIEDLEKEKAELEAAKIAVQTKIDKDKAILDKQKNALEDQIDQAGQKSSARKDKKLARATEALVEGVLGEGVFTREDPKTAVKETRATEESAKDSTIEEAVPGQSKENLSDADKKPKEERFLYKEKTMEEWREQVDGARHKYAAEDYDNTNKWLKIKNFFRHIKQEKSPDQEYYQAQYNNALIDLRNAELAKTKQSGLQGKELNEALAETLKYFKYDELANVVNERTRVRIEHQGFGGKVLGMVEAIGKGYNSLSFKQKMVAAGASFGLAGVTGGTSLFLRRMFAGAGTAVALEAVMEKISNKREIARSEKEVWKQMETWEEIDLPSEKGAFLEESLRHLNKMFEQEIFYLDEKLQEKKRAALLRKTLAFGAGFGAGYFAQHIFHALGVDDLIKDAKEGLMHGLGGEDIGHKSVDLFKEQTFNEMVPGSGSVLSPENPAILSDIQAAMEAKSNLIHDFVNQDIVVEKGDSVWKISGRLADNLGLDGAERTHFIDAMKDQFGDVQLKAGEHINFSTQGINDDFVKHALEQSNALSPEQSAQILEHNTRLSAFTEANPDVKLTNELTKNILEGKAGVSASPDVLNAETIASSTEEVVYVPSDEAIPPEFRELDLDKRVNGWYKQIFKVENVQFGERVLGRDAIEALKLRDILQDARLFQQGATDGYTTGMNRQEIANFARFFQGASQKEIGFDAVKFLRENPNMTLRNYFENVAPLVKFGTRIGPYYAL